MPSIHDAILDIPPFVYVLAVFATFAMTIGAVMVGWYSREAARERAARGVSTRGGVDDAWYAALTVALVPFGFGLLMLWARFG